MTQAKIYKGRYLVTEAGDLIAMNYGGRTEVRVLAQYVDHTKNRRTCPRVTIGGRKEYVHRIVAECFCERGEGCVDVRHRDGDVWNNDRRNLEWVPRRWDVRKPKPPRREGPRTRPDLRKTPVETVREIKELLWDGFPGTRIARILGVRETVVLGIQRDLSFKDVPWPERERKPPMGRRDAAAAAEEYMKRRRTEQCQIQLTRRCAVA